MTRDGWTCDCGDQHPPERYEIIYDTRPQVPVMRFEMLVLDGVELASEVLRWFQACGVDTLCMRRLCQPVCGPGTVSGPFVTDGLELRCVGPVAA
jgi:hypothetical protein